MIFLMTYYYYYYYLFVGRTFCKLGICRGAALIRRAMREKFGYKDASLNACEKL